MAALSLPRRSVWSLALPVAGQIVKQAHLAYSRRIRIARLSPT